jgi:tetratricopeptide (TPR) repeat protein
MRVATLAAVLAVTLTSVAQGQCPDGRPIATCTVASAAPKRVDPPLDAKAWIIVPFDVAGSGDIGWLRNVSANLMYLQLAQWTDIRVIDDERVGDLIADVPEAQGPKLTLEAARAVARRAGAGNLVMGDVLKIGSSMRLTAKVYTVRDGVRVRTTPTEVVTVEDSLQAAFSRLARGALNAAAPPGSNAGSVGTANIQAVQAYVAGIAALNGFDLAGARGLFELALKRDSTFALAHYKLAVTAGWEMDATEKVSHAEAAARLSTGLPAREQKLISGMLAFQKGDYARACDAYGQLARTDSSDVEALYGLGDCSFHDDAVEPVGPDSAHWRFRGDWNTAMRAFRRALVVDPTFHPAYQHITDMLIRQTRLGCRRRVAFAPCEATAARFSGVLRRAGDTLVIEPFPRGAAAGAIQAEAAQREHARADNLALARKVAQDWVDAAPREYRARRTLANIYTGLGNYAEAEAQLAQTGSSLRADSALALLTERVELAVKGGSAAGAGAATRAISAMGARVDSFATHPAKPADTYNDTWMRDKLPGTHWLISPVIGRITPPPTTGYYAGSLFGSVVRGMQRAIRVMAGAAVDSIESMDVVPAGSFVTPVTLMYGLRLPRKSWPAVVDTTVDPVLLAPAYALAHGDTAALRRAATRAATLSTSNSRRGLAEDGLAIVAADALTAVGDSLAALNVLRGMLDNTMLSSHFATNARGVPNVPAMVLWPRAMLMRADLAAKLGFRDEATTWYVRFTELWSNAGPELKPLVDRANAALLGLR